MAKILIVDDEETIRKLLGGSIEKRGHQIMAVEDGHRACDVYDTFLPDVIVTDIKMPRMNGFQMFDALKKKFVDLPPVIFITGHGEKSAAIDSLRHGAFDYLEKPFDMEEFQHTLDSAIDKRRITIELAEATTKLAQRLEARTELVNRVTHNDVVVTKGLDVLGKSPAMSTVRQAIDRLSKNALGSDMTVLITGPSGSGKEVVARLLHDTSGRKKGPWVALNCGALPENIIESELFGHEKGAFTGANNKKPGVFEMADGGTLFLDEIGELPLHMQSKLLRAIQERCFRRVGGSSEIKVDVRIIAATNRDLQQDVASKTFREDLFYRLNTIQIHVPALKERGEDIMTLARVLLKECNHDMENSAQDFSSDASATLMGYAWPGNVRELKSVVQRTALLCQGSTIDAEIVNQALGKSNVVSIKRNISAVPNTNSSSSDSTPSTSGLPYHKWKKEFVHTMERNYLADQLSSHDGNVSALSRTMKISRPNLCRLLKKHGLLSAEFKKKLAQAA